MDWKALEPRIGAAWKVFGSDKTCFVADSLSFTMGPGARVRTGYGRTRPSWASRMRSRAAARSQLRTVRLRLEAPSAISLSSGFQAITTPPTPGTFTGSFYTQPTDFKLGRVYQYNGNVEREVFGSVVLTAGYAGSHGSTSW